MNALDVRIKLPVSFTSNKTFCNIPTGSAAYADALPRPTLAQSPHSSPGDEMNLSELKSQNERPSFKVGPTWLAPLFAYTTKQGSKAGVLPLGTQITITGEPGVGKTRVALQILDAIAIANPELTTEFVSYEADASMLKNMVNCLDIKNIGDYKAETEDDTPFEPVLAPNKIVVIDSLDAWASIAYDSPYPSVAMANYLFTAKKAGCTIILVHHKLKGNGKQESGSGKFRQLTDIVLELKNLGNNQIRISAPAKNRYPGQEQQVKLVHTNTGLVPAPPTAMEALQATFTKWIGG